MVKLNPASPHRSTVARSSLWTALGLVETQRFGFQSSQDSCSTTIMPDRRGGANLSPPAGRGERCRSSAGQRRFPPHHTALGVHAHPPEALVGC
jgi:hypothetical protein